LVLAVASMSRMRTKDCSHPYDFREQQEEERGEEGQKCRCVITIDLGKKNVVDTVPVKPEAEVSGIRFCFG
jgi:hypothetical protein